MTTARRLLALEATCLLLVVLTGAVVVALHVRDDHRLSPIDELQHIDYMAKAGQFHLPRVGETDGSVARHEAACRGIEAPYTPPPCATAETAPNSAFPEDAASTAASDPPLYYVVTGTAARGVRAVLHLDSLATAGRLVGIGWLVAGVLIIWLLLREVGVGLIARTAIGLILVTTPTVVHAHATVTSDATLLVAGAAAMYVTLLWERRRVGAWMVVVIAILCGLSKVPALLAVGAASLYLLVRALRMPPDPHATRRRVEMLAMAAAAAAATAITALVWLAVTHRRAVPGAPTAPSDVVFHAARLRLDQVVAATGSFLSPVSAPPILAPLNSEFTVAVLSMTNALALAGAFGAAALAGARSRVEAVSASVATLMLVGGPLFVVTIFASDHIVLPDIPHRYGLALVPTVLVGVGALLGKAWMRWSVAVFAAVSAVYTVGHLAAR